MFCDNCGVQLREDAKFCHVCGAEQLSLLASEQAEPEFAGKEEESFSESAQEPQPLCGTFSWENVNISGEFKNGTGTLTITFS